MIKFIEASDVSSIMEFLTKQNYIDNMCEVFKLAYKHCRYAYHSNDTFFINYFCTLDIDTKREILLLEPNKITEKNVNKIINQNKKTKKLIKTKKEIR